MGPVPNSMRNMDASNKGMVLPFTPLSLTFFHMNYYVPMPKVREAICPAFLSQLLCHGFCCGPAEL